MTENVVSVTLAIDAVGAKHSGAAAILSAVVNAALENRRIGKIVLFLSPKNVRRFSLVDSPLIEIEERPKEEKSPLARILWFERGLGQAVKRHHADVLLTLSAGGRPPVGTPAVAYLHNCLPFTNESLAKGSFSMRVRLYILRWTIGRSVNASDVVVVQSKSFRDRVLQALRIRNDKVKIISPSAPILPRIPEELPEKLRQIQDTPTGQRLLCVTSNAIHKNVSVVVEAVRRLNASNIPMRLFLTYSAPPKEIANSHIVYLGGLNQCELSAAYANSDFLVMPSLAETIGLPLLEAMSVRLPIVAADRPYAREVTDGNAEFFDPLSVTDLVQKLICIRERNDVVEKRIIAGFERVKMLEAQTPYKILINVLTELVLYKTQSDVASIGTSVNEASK